MQLSVAVSATGFGITAAIRSQNDVALGHLEEARKANENCLEHIKGLLDLIEKSRE
jgi:hypothetical protein